MRPTEPFFSKFAAAEDFFTEMYPSSGFEFETPALEARRAWGIDSLSPETVFLAMLGMSLFTTRHESPNSFTTYLVPSWDRTQPDLKYGLLLKIQCLFFPFYRGLI